MIWQSIKTAPTDGTWIQVRGHDYGEPRNKRHYAIAFFEGGNWHEVGSAGGLLHYLDGWRPLGTSPAPETAVETI